MTGVLTDYLVDSLIINL